MMITKQIFLKSCGVTSATRLILTLSFLLITLFALSSVQARDVPLDKIAAVVNNDVVMLSEVLQTARKIKESGNTRLSDSELVKKVLEKLILEKIQVQKAKEIGVKIDNVALNEAMQRIAAQNKLNLEQFRVALKGEGLNYKDFRETIREKLYIDTLKKRQQGRNKKISENEVDSLIQSESLTLNKDVQYHLVDILFPAPNGISVKQFNARYKQAQNLRKRLLAKSDKLSQAIIAKAGASKKDLGWKSSQSLSPVFLRTLSLMGEGELSNVVRDAVGFHILKLVEQRGGKRKITQQAQARHILISNDTPNAKLKATQIRNKILAGESFAKLAQLNSADKGSAANGGDLGMVDPAGFVPPFANAVRTLPLNTLSQPIKTRFGWHLIEVLERKTTDQTREALKLQAQSLISDKNKSEEYNNWLQGLMDEAFIEYRL
ncbi:MAG TPA: molecular chaperone SurA [Leucothrix sp.]|nr:molecular chaperone SurA [Leucothrix sp.]